LARRVTRIDALRGELDHVLLVDAGNWSDNTLTIGLPKSRFVFRMLGRLDYDAVAFGEQDLRHGPGVFRSDDPPSPPILTSNLVHADDGRPYHEGHRVLDVGPLRVGVFGLLSMHTPPRVIERFPGMVLEDPEVATGRVLRAMDTEGVDVVVLLAQLERAEAESLLVAHDAIDVVVMGHPDARPYRRGAHPFAAVPIYPRTRGQGIARLDCVIDPDGRVIDHLATHDEMHVSVEPDPAALRLVNALDVELHRLQTDARLARRVELENREHASRYLGDAACARCHADEYASWQATAHAHAYDTLVELDMDRESACLPCHTVGHGETTGFQSPAVEPSLAHVQCESCHGMGSDHHGALVDADAIEATCVRCHDADNSPRFDLATYLEKIRHW